MASLYRKPVTYIDPKSGEKTKGQSKKWWGMYRDSNGKLCRVPLAIDKLAALLSVGIAVLRRNRTVLVLAAGAVVWVAVEIAFALHGWPALQRYLFEPAAVMIVLAAVAVGLIYSVQNLADFQAIQSWRLQWLLAALVAFVAGILLKKPSRREDE